MSRTLFTRGSINITEEAITFPLNVFQDKTVKKDDVIGFKYRYNNLFMYYIWRFIIGTLQLFTILGSLEAIKILRGDVLAVIEVKRGFTTKEYKFWVRHSDRKAVKEAIIS